MDEILELALKKLNDLEKKLERYYHLLYVENELDYILNGSYLLENDVQKILEGKYLEENNE